MRLPPVAGLSGSLTFADAFIWVDELTAGTFGSVDAAMGGPIVHIGNPGSSPYARWRRLPELASRPGRRSSRAASRNPFGANSRSLALRPGDSLTIRSMALSIGFRVSVSLHLLSKLRGVWLLPRRNSHPLVAPAFLCTRDYLVRPTQHRRRDGQAWHLGRLDVDEQLPPFVMLPVPCIMLGRRVL